MWAVPAAALLFSSSLGLVGSIAHATDIALVALPEEVSVAPMRALAQELSCRGYNAVLHLPGGLGPRTDEVFRSPNKATGTTSINGVLNEEAINGGIFAAGAMLPCYGCWEAFGDGKLELYAAGYLNRSAFHSSPITGNAAESSTLPGSQRTQELTCLFPSPLVHQPLAQQQLREKFAARGPQSSTEADDDATVEERRRASVSGTHEMTTPAPVYGWGAAEVASFISFHAGIPVSTASCALAGLNGRSIIDGAQQGAAKTGISGMSSPLLGQYEGRVLTAAMLAELGVTSSRAQSKVLKALGAASSVAAAAENRGAKEAENWCALLENKFDLGAELSCNDKDHNNHNSEAEDSCGEGGSYQPDHSSCSSSNGADSSDANSGNDCNCQSKKERLGVFQLLWKVLKAGTNRLMTAFMQWLFSNTTEIVDFMHTTSDNQVDRVAEYAAWLAYADQFEDVMLEPLLTAWTTKRPSLVVCDRWCYACLDAAEFLNLPLVIYNSGLLSQLHDDISTVQASWRPPAAIVRLMARFKAMEIQIRLKLRLRRYSQVRDARRARYGLASVADRGSLMSGDRSFSAPNQPLVRNGHSSSSSSSSERRGSKRGTHMLALSSSPYRALAVISGSVIDVEMTQNLPPSVHLTGPIRVNDGISSGDDARPRAQLPAKLLHWIEGTDRTQPTLDSSWVAHSITNDNENTSKDNDDNGTSSSWAVRPAPIVVVDLGPHWASNAQLSRAAWTQAGREALALLQVALDLRNSLLDPCLPPGVGVVNSTGHALAKRPPGPPSDLRIASAVSNNANAGLAIRVVWLLPEDQWGLLPKQVLQTANAPGSSLMLVSPLGVEGVRASNGKLDALLAHGNVAALVACGGVERTHRALLHRKPLLLLPRSSADHELALKLSALRVAVAIDMDFVNEATPEASGPVCSYWSDVLNEGLWRLLLDPKVPGALASVAKLIQGGGGVQRAVNLIVQALVLSTSEEDDANFDEFSTVNERASGSSHVATKEEAKQGSVSRPHSGDLAAERAAAGQSNNGANRKYHQRADPSASFSEALSAADNSNSITRRESLASESIRLLSASVRNSHDFGLFPWDVLAAHAIAAMAALLSGKFLLKVFLQVLKRAAQLLVRKLVTRPMGLRAKSSANNFGTSNGRPQVPNDDVNDRCEGGADEEEGWPELLLALAAVPLALVGCACRVFGRFAVSWVGVPLLDLLLGPADVSLDAHAPQSFSSIGGASYQAALSLEETNYQNEKEGSASSRSSSSGDASGVSSGVNSSGSRCGRRKRERAAMTQPPYGFPSVEGEVSPGLVLPPQPVGITRLIFGPGVCFGIYIMQSPGRGLYVSHVEPGYGLGVTTGDLLVEMNGERIALGAPEIDVTTRLQSLPRPVVLGFSRRGLDFMSALKEDYSHVPGT